MNNYDFLKNEQKNQTLVLVEDEHEKIERMQNHFNSISDDGILFINYPMIEAYRHILSIPDEDYLERHVSVKCQPGREYKRLVEETSVISKYFNAYDNLLKYLSEKIKDAEDEEISYWEELRRIVIYIVTINIEKATKVQKGVVETTYGLKEKYLDIDWTRILDEQNLSSRNPETGIIWVLCTCVTFLADYKFFWRMCE